ncbi:MAG: hypothetical protein ACFFCT_13685, partial [Candidatus Odinarchaeota archaeon]
MGCKLPLLFIAIITISLVGFASAPSNNHMIALTGSHILSENNAVLDPGFESGAFGSWVNVESVSENQIQSSVIHSGSYALRMDSIYFIWAYVDQIL